MSDYFITQITASDKRGNRLVDELLTSEGIRRDGNLDYTCGMYDDEMNLIATGSCFGNTLRCMAVSHEHQGEGLMNSIVSHLIELQFSRGNTHLFLYTKCDSARFFGDLGFYEIARINGQIVFMENKRTGFPGYLNTLAKQKEDAPRVAALVMNANPFTLGHQYLVEKAAAENDTNIRYHDSGPYIISNATFPSYFQKDEKAVIESHAMLDLTVFTKIAAALGINRRYVGEEPTSLVTGIYNQIMSEKLPENGIECIIVPRKENDGKAISASTVRQALKEENWELLRELVPETTLDYFQSPEAQPVLEKICTAENVIHY